jgi:Cft2 family RNA processing exonuclease
VTRSRHGLHAPAAKIHLDARSAPGTVFVSHAHSDHCSSAPRIICTQETAALHARRKRERESVTLEFHQPFACADATIELLPAGHTLGSAMAMITSEKGAMVYTGDYKLRDNPFSPPAAIPRCDVLVMECTFGSPLYRFPPNDELFARLFAFIDETLATGRTPVVLAYSFGKGQEALYHLTRRGYDVLVKDPTAAYCDLHVELGYGFPGPGTWERFAPELLPGRVVLAPPGWKEDPAAGIPRARTVQLTGWGCNPRARYMYGYCDLVLPISDHADFDDLVRTAVESGASKIYTVHGSPVFAAHLRSMGLDAEHLAAHPSKPDRARKGSGSVTTAPVAAQYSLELA